MVELAAILGIPEDSVFGTDAWGIGGKVDPGEETLFNAGQSSVPILATREVATLFYTLIFLSLSSPLLPIADFDKFRPLKTTCLAQGHHSYSQFCSNKQKLRLKKIDHFPVLIKLTRGFN